MHNKWLKLFSSWQDIKSYCVMLPLPLPPIPQDHTLSLLFCWNCKVFQKIDILCGSNFYAVLVRSLLYWHLEIIPLLQEAFRAFHNDQNAVKKFLKPIHIGSLPPTEDKQEALKKDFIELRETAEKMVSTRHIKNQKRHSAII